jgi:hypothetical protein
MFSVDPEEPITVEEKAEELAHYLEKGEDPLVRLCCLLKLVPLRSPVVDRAFLRALADPSEDVVLFACPHVADRCGAAGTTAIRGLLDHPSWDVRLTACVQLIQQKTADQRVLNTLEALRKDPKAAEHDAFDEEFRDFNKDLGMLSSADKAEFHKWGTMESIVKEARKALDQQTGSDNKPS